MCDDVRHAIAAFGAIYDVRRAGVSSESIYDVRCVGGII